MLSTSVVKNVSEAGHYYAATDNYYTLEEGVEQSEWFGKGSTKMNLEGRVESSQFTALLRGELSNGEIIGKKVNDKILHRPGWDLTFSAPKSVSIMALIAGDRRLIEAHRNAVKTALSAIERGCSEVRLKNKNTMSYSLTKNMTASLFHHDLSRAEDPQLHTHSVIMNLTQRHDGKWRSMASKLGRYDKDSQGEVHGFIERVRNNQRYYGKLYETELAYQVQKLGYEISIDEKTGVFQIQGVSHEMMEHFSKRRNKIKTYMEEKGFSGSKAAEFATLQDREKKKNSNRVELYEKWKEVSHSLGFDGEYLIKHAEDRLIQCQEESPISIKHKTLDTLVTVVESLSQLKTTFSMEELVQEASIAMIHYQRNVDEMLQGIDQLIEKGQLMQLENDKGKSFLMSKNVLDDEKTIQTILNKHQQIPFQNHLSQKIIKQFSSNKEEHKALLEAFSQDKYVLIEGHRTREVVSHAISSYSKNKLDMIIVSPNMAASNQFSHELKKAPNTLWEKLKSFFVDSSIPYASTRQFLTSSSEKVPDMVLVDKAHLLSASEQAKLLEWGETHSAKMLFFSEKDLLLSQKRSVDVNYLIKHGIKTVFLDEKQGSIRHEIHQGNLDSLFEKIQNHIVEVPEKEERLHSMATHFVRLNHTQKTYLVASNMKEATQLNSQVHDQLKEEGKLKKCFSVNVLIPHFMPEHRRKNATAYTIGDVIRIKKNESQSEYMKIVGVNKEDNQLLIQQKNKPIISWVPTLDTEIFKEEKREWGIGERLQAHRSMKYAGVVKDDFFTVEGRSGNRIKLSRDKGKSIYIDITKPYQIHFDYGYANTAHKLSHVKADHLIADLSANSFTTDKRRFFQIIAQPEKISLYTDNINHLFDTLQNKSGNKPLAQEVLQSSIDIKNEFQKFYEILEKTIQTPHDTKAQLTQKAVLAVDYAMRHLSERNAGFTHKELMKMAMKQAIGHVNQQQLLDSLQALEKAGVMLRGHGNDGVLWTTQEAVKLENEIIHLTKKDSGTLSPIASCEVVERFFAGKSLHAEKIEAIKSIVESQDRVLTIQGRAGTGKTTMMESLSNVLAAKELLNESGYQVQGIAPTHKAVKELKSRGIPSITIDQFLLDMRNLKEQPLNIHLFDKTVLIIDEASMVSNRKMRDILSVAHEYGFRQIIPTGDTPHQLAAIEAGKPHHLIQQLLDDKVIRLEDIRRQKNPVLKEAVSAIYKGDVQETFSVLGNAVIEIKEANSVLNKKDNSLQHESYQKRVQAIARDYVTSLDKKEDVQIITPSHADRKAVNQEVRLQLETKGYLKGETSQFTVLVSHDMTAVERYDAKNFKVGHLVKFTRTSSSKLHGGDYFTIKTVNARLNTLTLSRIDDASKELLWRIPASSERANNQVEVFKKEERQLKVGDKIVWVKTNRKENIQATEAAIVKAIGKDHVTLVRDDKTEFTFNAKEAQYQHWDHAYAITAYGAQGGTYSSVLGFFESYRKNLMNMKTFLVTLTRPENELRIYTNDKEKLIAQITSNKGDKLSSLEVIGEYPTAAKKQKFASSPMNIMAPQSQTHEPKLQYDLQQIKDGLNQNAEQIAIEILGQPKVRGGNYLKFGSNHGSLSVTTKGEKAGWWNDFSDNHSKGRTMLSFIEKQLNISKSDAIEYAASWLGMMPSLPSGRNKSSSKSNNKSIGEPSSTETTYQKKMRSKAIQIAKESTPLSGTLAEIYLKEHRGIDTKSMKLSDDIRFHRGIYSSINKQKLPALVSLIRDKKGEIIAVESVYLDSHSGNKAANIAVGKQTFGAKKLGSVTIQLGQKGDTVVLTEGVVTGLSVAKSLPNVTIKSVLGKQLFSSIAPESLPKKVIFCLDYDGKELRADKSIQEAANRLKARGKDVHFMMPHLKNSNKYDYNDVLKIKGEEAIQFDFKKAISYQDFYRDDALIKAGLAITDSKINLKITNERHKNQRIGQAEINQVAKQITNENRHHQNLHQVIDKTLLQKSIDKAPEIKPSSIQLERDI